MIIFLDLDGTLCDDRWRRPAMPDWDAYHAGIPEDKPRAAVLNFIEHLDVSIPQLIILTGRPSRYAGPTLAWLEKYGVGYDELLMRPDDDYRSNAELKLSIVQEYIGGQAAVEKHDVLIIDNNQKVADLLRTEGFEVWLVE